MADTAARLAISARRNEVARFTIAVIGIDMTDVAMAMQVRLGRDVPGAPLIALATVSTLAAEGLKFDSVSVSNGIPTSIIKGRINASTMTDATKVPYSGEVGDDTVLDYAMQWTLGGDAQTRLYGDFIVLASAFGSDGAPTNRPVSYGGSSGGSGSSASGSLTFGDQVISVSINGADIIAPLTSRAEDAATRAEAASASATALAADIPVAGDNASAALAAALILTDAVPAVPVGPNPNILRANVPGAASGVAFDILITADITGETRLIAGGLDRVIARDGGGNSTIAGDLLRGQIASLKYSAGGGKWVIQRTRYANDRDPLASLRPYLIENPWGAVRKFLSRGGGSSISVGQGGGDGDAPNDMFVALLNARKRQDGFQAVSQIVGQPGTGTLDMEAQFANAPASEFPEMIRTYVPGMNDCYFRLFVMQHGFPNILAGLKRMLLADAAAGRISIIWTSPHPHPGRVNLADGMPADKPMTYPVYKAAPVTAADVRAQLGTDTVMRDWTGNGVITPGSRTFAQYNAAIETLCRSIPTAICIDAAWTFFRYGLEPAYRQGASAIDALYYGTDQNHFSPAGYNAGYRRATIPAVDAILNGDVGTRCFRGVPDGGMLSLPLLAQSELGSPTANNGKLARINYEGTDVFVGALNGAWRPLSTGAPLAMGFNFARGVMPDGATVARAAGPYSSTGSDKAMLFATAANIGRLDYHPVTGAARGLLLEPQSTNLQIGSTIINTPNFRIYGDRTAGGNGPNGTATARLKRNSANTNGRVFDQYPSDYGGGDNVQRVMTAYVRNIDAAVIEMTEIGFTKGVRLTTSTGAVTATGGSTAFQEAAAGGMTRIGFAAMKTNGFGYWVAYLDPSSTLPLTTAEFGLIQIEARTTPTSYIPTTTAAATRPGETLTLDWGGLGVPDGNITVRYTFDGGSTQDVTTAVASGKSTIAGGALNGLRIMRADIVTA